MRGIHILLVRPATRFQALAVAVLTLAAPSVFSQGTPAGNAYLQHNLVADQPGIADFTDANLVNPWGIYESSSSPFWVSVASTGLATVYSGSGVAATTKPTVPPSAKGGSAGSPTGGVFNGTGGFLVQGKAPNFIFATVDGTISAWASAVNPSAAQLMVDNSSAEANYYGLAVNSTAATSTPMLYAANFHSGHIDVFDTNFKPVTVSGTFSDPAVPSGYAPFNVQNLSGKLYVMWAPQNTKQTFPVAGAGTGAVSIFDLNGNLLQHVATGGPLNDPWGVAIAPSTFGAFAGDLLIGNFGDGAINAFNPTTGASLGTLQDQNGNTIHIPGLWGLIFGNGGSGGDPNLLYFTAGYTAQNHGLLGSLQAAPVLSATAVVNAADGLAGIAMNTWVSIFGSGLAPVTRSWAATDFNGTKLPTSLDGVSVTINGKPAYVYYISAKQIDVLAPVDTTAGTVQVQVNDNGLVSNTASTTLQPTSPAFFLLKDNKSIAAVHGNGDLVGAASLYPGLSTPAAAGETIALFGTGLGQTNPAISDGNLVSAPAPCVSNPTVSIGGANAQVVYCGLISAGVYQVNVIVPSSTASGTPAVLMTAGALTSATGAVITVQ